MSDTSERTEQATPRHLEKVHKEGKLSRSQDLSAWAGIGAGALMLPFVVSTGSAHAVTELFRAVQLAQNPDPDAALTLLKDALGGILTTVAPVLAAVCVTVIGLSFLQGGIRFREFKLRTESLNPINGIKHMFGTQSLWNLAKSLLKIVVVGLALYVVVLALEPTLLASGAHTVQQLLGTANGAVTGMLAASIGAGLAIAGLDLMVVLRRNRKMTMMTKREVRDENKQNDGDPHIRQQRRSRQLAMSRGRMLQAVSTADVVMLNPTHYAVALHYEPGKSAPRVVAKGQGAVAARIRDEAEKSGVPMVRDIPLTRALHAAVPLGGEIPPEYYTIIAQVLTFVAMLKRRGSARGVHDLPGGHAR